MPETYRFYLDQMLRLEVARALTDEGYDVLRATEVGQERADDFQILQTAINEDRILITLDHHFGDWVILPLSEHTGVIRLQINPTTSQNAISLLLPFFVSEKCALCRGPWFISQPTNKLNQLN